MVRVADTMRIRRVAEPRRLGVGGDPAAQRARLADIEDLAVAADHAVDAGLARQRAHELADDPHAVGQRTFGRRALTRKRVLARFLVGIGVGFVAHGVLPKGARNG